MKVVFVNPPVLRSKDSTPGNDFALDGQPFPARWRRVPGIHALWRKARLGGTIRYGVRAGSRWPWTMDFPFEHSPFPFFMGYAASAVQHLGHRVALIDSVANEDFSYSEFLARVDDELPDLIIQECSTPTADIDLWLSDHLSKIAEVAVCGPHFSEPEVVEQALRQHPSISYVLQGEYIEGAKDLVSTLAPGIYPSRVVRDLDSIPFPFRAFRGAMNYYDPSMPTPRPQLQLVGSKGCPFGCTFCSWPQAMYGRRVALRTAKSIGREIREALATHRYQSLFFDDDTFNLETRRVSAICDELAAIGLPWTMMGRLDVSPDWLYNKMVDSGCVGMRFGVETFNLDVLAKVKKGIERMDFRQALARLASRFPHVMLHVTMMRDMPGQTEAMHQDDMRIMHDMGFSPNDPFRSYQLSRCAPFPGTALYDELKLGGDTTNLGDFKRYDGSQQTVLSGVPLP